MVEIFSLKNEWKSGKGKSKFEVRSFNFYYNKFKRMFCSVYKWTLPEELDADVIEKYLFEDGICIIWQHSVLGWITTRCNVVGRNINGKPNRFKPYFDANLENVKLPEGIFQSEFPDKPNYCIPIFDTSVYGVKRSDAMFLIEEIVDIGETIRTQTFNQKTPLLAISGNQQARQKNMISIMQIENNAKVLFCDEKLSDSLKTLDFNAPFNVEKLNALRNVRINEILESAGIDGNDPYFKADASHALVSQVESNDEILNYILADALKPRKKAAEAISKAIGPASVDIQEFIRPEMFETQMQQPEENNEENEVEENDDKSD